MPLVSRSLAESSKLILTVSRLLVGAIGHATKQAMDTLEENERVVTCPQEISVDLEFDLDEENMVLRVQVAPAADLGKALR